MKREFHIRFCEGLGITSGYSTGELNLTLGVKEKQNKWN